MEDGHTTGGHINITRWLGGSDLDALFERFDEEGYLIFPNILSTSELADLREALAPHLAMDVRGRNNFEGFRSNRVYAMLAKSPVFADLAIHPLVMAFVERDLGTDALLSACLAISLQPGETVQPWHFDDSHYQIPRPRQSLGVSAFWAVSDLTEENGATEFIPGSHMWPDSQIEGGSTSADFLGAGPESSKSDPHARSDALKAIMPAGSLMLTKGTLWHRGGANRSDEDRILITPQYCPGWTRQLENMVLAVPPKIAKALPERAQELIGYSISAPFMGYVNGMHPKRALKD